MKCVICKTGEMLDGRTTATLQRGETTMVITRVPARICDTCGDYYLSEDLSERVLAMADGAVGKGAEWAILRWAA